MQAYRKDTDHLGPTRIIITVCHVILVPGAGLEPARTLPGPRDFKSRVSTNSTIRALTRPYENKTEIETISLNRGDYHSLPERIGV